MDIVIILFFVLIFGGSAHAIQTCVPEPIRNCTERESDAIVILVDHQIPKEKCSSIKIGNISYIYDRVQITKVSITLVNTNQDCNTISMNKLNQNLNLIKEEVIFISVDTAFFQIVFVNQTNSSLKAAFFPAKFEEKLKSAKLVLYPSLNDPDTFGQVCLNGGLLNTKYTGAGYRCNCSRHSIAFGPRCEYMDRVLNSSIYYFNVFHHPKIINLTFSLFSNGVKNNQSLLTIKNSLFQKVAEVSVRESAIFLNTSDNNANEIMVIDKQVWHEFYLDVSREAITLRVSQVSLHLKFTTPITENFTSHYLVLKEDNSNEYNFCIRSLKSNERIIDLNNGDGYESCCLDRCKCKENEDCACSPFISSANTKCYCKIGYQKIDTTGCKNSSLFAGQITDSQEVIYKQEKKLNRMDLIFRTLSTNGTIVTLIPDGQFSTISTMIVNTNLTLNVGNRIIRPIDYNVSDGVYHKVTLNVKDFSLEMILDNNANYSVAVSNWATNFSTSIIYSSFKLGPLYRPFNSTINTFTSCFAAIRINGISEFQYDINITSNKNTSQGCDSGPRCSELKNFTCPEYQVCKDNEWQNTKCICIANFTLQNSKCIYNKCLTNPCNNHGQCIYNNSYYSCICNDGFRGYDCEIDPSIKASLWWLAILIVLFLLLILLIVLLIYCCCFNKRRKPDVPSIVKIQENTVIYNEQAGECDYNGPPINYNLMKNALYNEQNLPKAHIYPNLDFVTKKFDLDRHNDDLVLDHPLEYGFEGYNSDLDSVSSLGSKSTNSQLNTMPLENTNKHFNHLNNLYK